MKRKLIKTLKVISISIFLFIIVFGVAILWPLPTLTPPLSHERIIITSANIIDVTSGNILENRDILIKDNRIHTIDTSGVLVIHTSDFVIDGRGKYVIPGLWDMHTHSNQHSEWLHHPLYIANGVTGIRDMSGQLNEKDSYWAGSKERLQWNNELQAHTRVTPRYVLQSSYQMDGFSSVPSGFPDFFKLNHTKDVDSLLQFYKDENVDFIKVYQQIPPDSYRKLATQAPLYGMHIAGHKPMFVSLEEAIDLGQRSFEHGRVFMYESFPKADSLRTVKDWKGFFKKSKRSMVADFNSKKATQLMKLMNEKDSYWVPTLQTLKFEAFAHKDTFLNNPNLKYITSARKKLWWGMDVNNNKKKNNSSEEKGLSTDFYQAAKEQVRMANQLNVPIMAGTDVTDSYIFAGFSLHDELEELTKSGLTPLEAIQSATITPARYAKQQNDYGTIVVGKIADIILLDKNPLQDIKNSTTISGVFTHGLYYDLDNIQELKTYTASIASSFHMSIKVLYSFIKSPLIRVQFAD